MRLTFSELAAVVERTARGLAGLGLGAQDRIGVWSTNCAEWVQLHLACARIGAVLVNVNPAYRAYELAFVLRKSRMKALFLVGEGQAVRLSRDSRRSERGAGAGAGARRLLWYRRLGKRCWRRAETSAAADLAR